MPLEIGSLLNNRYRVEQTIAAGGMGAVYRAIDESLSIAVAVKENFFSTDEYSRQFRREATILASLRHPNLPRVTDHFVIAGQGQYLVMDFIEGVDLRELITSKGKLAEEDVARIGVAISDALAYLHSRNPAIVHRDIKPGNIKITPTGHVFLVDFGLAKLAQGGATTTGAQGLTPGYAPPEQYGQGTEPRSDQYALGATLYAALTGKIPEDGLSRAMGSAELTSIRKHNAQVTEGMARVIERAMGVQVAERYETSDDFKGALLMVAPYASDARPMGLVEPKVKAQAAQSTKLADHPAPTPAEPLTRKDSPTEGQPASIRDQATIREETAAATPAQAAQKKRGMPLPAVLGIGGVLILAVITAAFFMMQGRGPSAPAPAASQTEVTNAVAPAAVTVTQAAPEPATSTPRPSPTPQPTETPAPTQTLPPAPTATNTAAPEPSATPTVEITPIGGGQGQLAFSSDRGGTVQVWLMNADGSDPKVVTNLADGACQPDWSPDGKRIVFISPCSAVKEDYKGTSLFIINADGTGLVPLPSLPGGDFDPAWSPNNDLIAFTSLRDGIPHIFVYNLADNKVTRLSRAVNHERRPAWSPDGTLIAYETTRSGQPQIWTMSAAGEDAQEFSILAGGQHFMPAWSTDGTVMVYSQGTSLPLLVSRQVGSKTAQEFPISDRIRPVSDARFSYDSWWIAFTSRQNNNTDIYRMTRNGGSLTNLTEGSPGLDFHPAWRPVIK